MKKIGVIGLGGIAQKAYMPVTMAMQDEVEWFLITRDPQKLEQLGKKYGITNLYTNYQDLFESGIEAVFIHTATHTHSAMVEAALNSGLHVFVDKPISENLAEVNALFALAAEKGLILTAGFNRRYAPMVQQLKTIPNKRMIRVEKNRCNKPGAPLRFTIYDIFIHSLDTALYLLDDAIVTINSHITTKDGGFARALVTIETATTTCVVTVNFEAGVNSEIMEVQAPEGTVRLDDLVDYKTYSGNQMTTTQFTDWESTLYKRGFESLIKDFIHSIEIGESPLTAESIRLSHEICEQMLEKHDQK